MADAKKTKLSTEPYKGVRDFPPEEMFIQNYLFDAMRRVAELYGYLEYNASILEPTEIYLNKTSEEIVNEQTYTFEDRGGRSVTLRPEMTPSVARMIAARRRELPLPARWFTIGNMFRYERPQRGRVREHWQLNADIFGVEGIDAEVEILSLISAILQELGASENDFVIKVNDRRLLNSLFSSLNITGEKNTELLRWLDGYEKMEQSEALKKLKEIVGGDHVIVSETLTGFGRNSLSEFEQYFQDDKNTAPLKALVERLNRLGVKNVEFDSQLARGFDYYTGVVFEVFDTAPDNSRALFGGGRYDDLLSAFANESMPAVGFGMGDVRLRDFLETHNLLPAYTPSTMLFIATTSPESIPAANELARSLREQDVPTAVNFLDRKVGEQFKAADKMRIPFALCVGENEAQSKRYRVKHLASGSETEVTEEELADFLWSQDV